MSEDKGKDEIKPAKASDAIGDQPSYEADRYRHEPPHQHHPHPYYHPAYPTIHHSPPELNYPPPRPDIQRSMEEIDPSIRERSPYDTPPNFHYPYYHPNPYAHTPVHPMHRSIHSEPNYSQRHRSSPETHHSAENHAARFSHQPHNRYWESPMPDVSYSHRYGHPSYPPPAAEYDDFEGLAGRTPPQTGDDTQQAAASSNENFPYKAEEAAELNPNEGFDTPPTYNQGSVENIVDDKKPASVPDNIYLNKSEGYSPSPEDGTYQDPSPEEPYHESPVSATNQNLTDQAPPLPSFQSSETNRADVANSSSNSSSHGAPSSSSSGSDFGWMRHYNCLLEYMEVEGHCDVPQKYQHGHINLGVWVNKQRMERRKLKKGRRSSMNPSRLAKLDNIGFNWGKEKGQASWDEKYEELKAFKRVTGHCKVKTKDKENKTLGRWVTSQRADYKNDRLSQEKIDKLNAIGFTWEYFKQDKR